MKVLNQNCTSAAWLFAIRQTGAKSGGKTHFLYLILLIFGWVLTFPALAADIKVTVDRNPVNLNESLQIVYSAAETPDDDPDFSPLQKDFEILNQGKSSNISMINGSFNKSVTWKLTVIPKRSGEITVPVIAFGQDKSQPTSIVVNKDDTSQRDIAGGKDLFLEVEATPQDPLVQAQVIYTLRLFRKVNISQASLTEPELDNAVVEKLGDDRNYNTQLNDESYVVTERRYAIFPQKSGAMTIGPLALTAEVITSNRSRFNGFFGSQSTRTKRVSSDFITLQVQPVPAAFTGTHWLPAEQLILDEEWSGSTQQVKVGEPLTRTLKLLAKGATLSQLPELFDNKQAVQSSSSGELKSYPDQPALQEQKNAMGVIALREEKIALIPSKAGTYQLPEINIPWWNTTAQQMEIATIPGKTITAAAATLEQPISSASEKDITETKPAAEPMLSAANNPWLWVSIFLACGWITTILYLLSRRQSGKTNKQAEDNPDFTLSELKKACRKDDALAAKDALIKWGRKQFNESSLSKIAENCDDDLKEQIQQLSLYLYDPTKTDWSGGFQLLLAFDKKNKAKSAPEPQDASLQTLYK